MSDTPDDPMSHNRPDSDITVRSLCPLPHRGHAPQIHPPATMCDEHPLHDIITTIARIWLELDDHERTPRDGRHTNGTKSQPPTRLDILALTDPHTQPGGDIPPAVPILIDTADWIADQLHATSPTTVLDALRILTRHWRRLTHHPDPVATYSELLDIRNALRRIAGEQPHIVGRQGCDAPNIDPQSDEPCGGDVLATGRVTGVIAACTTCGAPLTAGAAHLAYMQRLAQSERA